MDKASGGWAVRAAALAVSVVTFGCGSTLVTALCVPGEQKTCACGGGIDGFQVCLPGGDAFGACECGSGGAGGGGAGGGGAGGGGGGGSGGSSIGGGGTGGSAACVTAADCASFTDECNTGACLNGSCVKMPQNEGAACDDGNACTVGDTCSSGVCSSTNLKPCPPSDECHVGFCDLAAEACVEIPGNDGASCDDADPCTAGGVCSGGLCAGGPPPDCSFLDDACHVGICVPAFGCAASTKAEGSPCDDGLFCTSNDTCSGGLCTGQPKVCPAPANACQVAVCDENNNVCASTAGNEGAPCDDGAACTTGEACSGGACVGGGPPPCQNGDGCCPSGCTAIADDDCACSNPGGGPLIAENGLGLNEFYCYAAGDNAQARALKACESHFGTGACCIITGGYNDLQYGQCNQGGVAGTIHWHWDTHPAGHCPPNYVIGDVVSPGWCGVILGSFLD